MSTTPQHADPHDETLTELTDVLTQRDVGFLRLLDGLAARSFAAPRPGATLFSNALSLIARSQTARSAFPA